MRFTDSRTHELRHGRATAKRTSELGEKMQRFMRDKRTGRGRWRNKHHLVPKSRGGHKTPRNMLLIDGHVHFQLHKVFGNRTLEEIIALLIRVQRAKRHQQRVA